ncbi:MAG TPA: hypothetical protein VGG89_12575 [Candidatus Baltobacteraceae bacterium]|jgi:hypothetical protein
MPKSEAWKPIERNDLARVVERQLADCSGDQRAFFEEHRVEFYPVPIQRSGGVESVYVVAEFGRGLLFFEDVEEGFELSMLDQNGKISSYGASQFELSHILERLRARESAAFVEIGSASFGQEIFAFLTTLVPYWRVSDDAWLLQDGSHLSGIAVLRNFGGDVLVVKWEPDDSDLERRLLLARSDETVLDPHRRVVVVDDRGAERSDRLPHRMGPLRVVRWSERQLLADIVAKDSA